MVTSSAFDEVDDAKARRNAVFLSMSQALYGIVVTTQITLGGLAGAMLAPPGSEKLATLPISLMMLANALTVIPMAMLMRRFGRRAGFLVGAFSAVVFTLVAADAIARGSFWQFTWAALLLGIYQATAGYYRFAAADTASAAFKPKAIAWVMGGGAIAALLGPEMVKYTKDLFLPVQFMGAYVALAGVSLLSIGVVAMVNIPPLPPEVRARSGRPILEIMRQRGFIVPAVCAMVSYGLMNLVMTATPLAMVACGLTVNDAAFVVQWHAFAMFATSFVTGHIIARFGASRVIAVGLLMLAGCGVVVLSGLDIGHFWFGLVLLGLGWNFGFIGATTLLTECYRPEERAKTQAANDFLVFGTVTLASFLSGNLFFSSGWETIAVVLFPFVAVGLAALGGQVMPGARRPA
ncbi:MAG: MFS transporter [Alphaproteobacteria bacterium]|nr:MFS transporter [Alphaproteobacteria bacterium]MDX5367874.1 MFS transporter [Alphaproteobacteria bacterium]MDX5462744.1 MFS transporter [Alphaproteobacteria bacterium]